MKHLRRQATQGVWLVASRRGKTVHGRRVCFCFCGFTRRKKEGSRNYAGVDSEVVDFLIEQLVGAKTRQELTTAIHALDRVLLWNHYVIPLYHSNTDRIAYWNMFEFPETIPLYGIVIESWWIDQEKVKKLNR